MTTAQFLSIVEIRTKIVSVSSFLIGVALVVFGGGPLPLHLLVLMAVAVLAVDMGTTAFNSYFDYVNGVDAADTNREQDKVLVRRETTSGQAFLVGLLCFIVAGFYGMALVWFRGPDLLWMGLACMAVGYCYNGGPLPLSRTPLGELFSGGVLGTALILLVVYVLQGTVSAAQIWLALPSWLMISTILSVNNSCDIEADTRAGRKTISILLGAGGTRWLVMHQMAAAHALWLLSLAQAGLHPIAALPILPSAAFWVVQFMAMLKRGFSGGTKGPNMGAISVIFMVFTLCMLASIVLGIAMRS